MEILHLVLICMRFQLLKSMGMHTGWYAYVYMRAAHANKYVVAYNMYVCILILWDVGLMQLMCNRRELL
jgi:hypothetical protein